MRNVLFVTFEYLPFAGGIASYTYQIAKGFFDLGCAVTVLAPHYPDCEDLDRKTPFRTVRMALDHEKPEAYRILPGLRALYRTVMEVRPDAVMLTSDLAHGLGAMVCSWTQVPFAAVVHGSEITKHFPPRTVKRGLQKPWLQYCYQHASAVFCVSEYVRGLVTGAGFGRQRLHVVYNGIDEALLEFPEEEEKVARVRERHGLAGKKVLMTVARLVARKGHDLMIRAMPEILRRQENACYVIVGVGEEEERLKALAKNIGVAQAVVFAGRAPEEEKLAYLDASDVFVLPSNNDGQRVEGLGIALLEAAAREKPLIGTACGGIREVVEDGVNGYLVGVTDARALAVRAAGLLSDPEKARAMGTAAKARVRERFTTSGMAERTCRLLQNAVESGGR